MKTTPRAARTLWISVLAARAGGGRAAHRLSRPCLIGIFTLLTTLCPQQSWADLRPRQDEARAQRPLRKFDVDRYRQQLLKGGLKSRLAAVNAIRNAYLDNEQATNLLVQACDQLLQQGYPDTSALLIIDTLRHAVPTPEAGEGLLRWFDGAMQYSPDEAETWRLVAFATLVSMRQSNHPPVLERATKLLESSDYQIQMLAADIVGRQQYEPALDVLIRLAESRPFTERYGFRHAMLEALTYYPQQRASATLLQQAEKLGGQLSFLIWQRLSQQPQRHALAGGEVQLLDTRTTATDPTTRGAGLREVDEYPYDNTQVPYPNEAPAYFYGHPIHANDVTFVLDISSSMNQRVRRGTRLDRAKLETMQAIHALPPTGSFQVILFANHVIDMTGGLVAASPANKAHYAQRIHGLRSRRWTNLYGSIKTALMDSNEPEVIFLVSDGEPTVGELRGVDEILHAVNSLNMFRRITINTVAIGHESPLLRELAATNAGDYRRAR